ncbi:MAG: hypothetical protein ACRD3C_23070 [Vicinamibacterales bacterium]
MAAVVFIATLAWRFFTFTGFSNDHYAHLALAQQMLLGERPIRDFSDPGWPLTYVISAIGWHLAGSSMAVEWSIVTLGFALGAAFTVAAAHRLSGSLTVALCVAVLELLIFPRTYSYPKMLAYGGAGWAMLALAANPSAWRLLLMAAVITVAFLLRHDHGAYIGAASVLCVVMATGRDWRLAIRRVALLTVATAAFVAPWAVYVTLNGGLIGYFDRGLEYARIEANATILKTWPRFILVPDQPLIGLARPIRPLAQVVWKAEITEAQRQSLERRYGLEYEREADGARVYYVRDTRAENVRALADDPNVAESVGLGRVQRPAWRELLAHASPLRLAPALHSLPNAQAWLYWLFWALPVACATIACWRVLQARTQWPGESAAVIGLAVMALLVDSGFLRDPLSARLADTIVLPALLGAWLLGIVWTERWRAREFQMLGRAVSLAILFVTTTAVAAVAELPGRIDYTGIRDGAQGIGARAAAVTRLLASPHRQTLAPPSRISEALMPFFSYLDRCTSPADQLIVTGDYADVLVLAGRGFASDGVSFGVWYSSVAHQTSTIADMQSRPALFTILVDAREFETRYEQVAAYVAQEYEPMADIAVEGAGGVRILKYRRRSASGADRETGWPCFR